MSVCVCIYSVYVCEEVQAESNKEQNRDSRFTKISNTRYELPYMGQNMYALCTPRAAALMYRIHQREVKQSKPEVCCARQQS